MLIFTADHEMKVTVYQHNILSEHLTLGWSFLWGAWLCQAVPISAFRHDFSSYSFLQAMCSRGLFCFYVNIFHKLRPPPNTINEALPRVTNTK